jgi:capsular exopolysaccharide synthesis family protein
VANPLNVSTTATVPGSPSSPKTARNIIAALIFGLLLGIALATGRDALDRRLRHSRDVTQVLDHPVVGHIRSEALGHAGRAAEAGGNGLGPLADPDEESFRILRQNVRYLAAASDTSTLLVTSAMAEEGKSTVAACLAVATAEAGKRTLLVECDLRRPVLATRFGIAEAPGMTDYLTGNAEPHEILQVVPGLIDRSNGNGSVASPAQSNLLCITSGATVPKPAELLASDRFRTFLAEVSQVYDSVILDTAPLLPVADTLSIIPDVATVLVCVRLERTTRDQARAAQSALDRLPDRPVGLVLTDVRDNEDGYYYGYYGSPKSTTSV